MRHFLAVLALLAAVPAASWAPGTAAHGVQSRGGGGDYYTNSRGNRVHRPVRAARAPQGASAKCRDGSYSFSQSRRGTCSHHGGVALWL